jgi:hypothetical protein
VKPIALRVGVALAVVNGLVGLAGAVVVLAHAGHNADVFVHKYPHRSRALGLAGSYVLAATALVFACLVFLGAWKLREGRRSGWVLLFVLAGLGAVGTLGSLGGSTARSVTGLLYSIPDVALLVWLLLPRTRALFQSSPHAVVRT